MKIEGEGKRLRIYIGENDRLDGEPLFEAIVRVARKAGLAGATVFKGIEGFGASSRIHTARILRLSEDLPIVVEIVDRAGRIESLLPDLDRMIGEGLVTLEDVHVVTYRARNEDPKEER